MDTLSHLKTRAAQAERHIILPEGADPRIREAAALAAKERLAHISLIVPADMMDQAQTELAGSGVMLCNAAEGADATSIATLHDLRKAKGMTEEAAAQALTDPLVQAAIKVRLGQADGFVAGAVATTAHTVRTALQILGRGAGVQTVSSFFLMSPPADHRHSEAPFLFTDCGLVIDPTAQQLADIASASAQSWQSLMSHKPRIAFLSFSSAGSAEHQSLDKIREAVALAQTRMPDLEIDGELQFDAALDATIRAQKAPDSPLTGRPDIFIFPDLASGNIGYKIAQRLGGIAAIGPVLQGLAKPANDLSRGCTAEDVIGAIAITALQAGNT